MSRRQKRETQRDRVSIELKRPLSAEVPSAKSADDRPDLLRPWLLAGATALLVARPLVTSDGGPWQGDGQPFAALWIILAVLWGLGAVGRPRLKLRFAWPDAAVAAFFVWWVCSAWLATKSGAPRPSLNMLWEGVGTLVAFFLLRQLAPVGRDARALVVVMIGLGVVLATVAFHQYFVTMPADRARFATEPDVVLREAGIDPTNPNSAEVKAFKARLDSSEPLATFSLTNSLAAYLAPWLILTLGIAARGTTDRERRTGLWLLAGACAIPLAAALALTLSRSAWIAAVVGGLLIWLMPMPGESQPRRRRWPLATAVALLAIVVGGGLAIWRPDLYERAFRSFSFRLEYWRSTLAMIGDRPLFGCGPGNFGDYYTQYKLPIASEEIKDPHNFLFEIAASAGLPALAALAAVLAALVWRVFCFGRGGNAASGEEAALSDVRNSGKLRGAMSGTGWIVGGAVLGIFLAMPVNWVLGNNIRGQEMLTGLLFGGVAVAALWSWVRDGVLPTALLATGIAVLFVALLAVGGITFGGVAGTLWLLLALVFNATDPTAARRDLPWGAALMFFVVSAALLLAQNQTGYMPTLSCNAATDVARAVEVDRHRLDGARASNPGTIQIADVINLEADEEKQIVVAQNADPYSPEPWRLLARLRLDQWRQVSDPRARKTALLDEFATSTGDHVLKLNPHSSAAEVDTGLGWMEAHRVTPGNTGYARTAALHFQRAVELYPNSAFIRAELAIALEAAGERTGALAAAGEALRLDDLMPHEDKKLSAELRKQVHRIITGEVYLPSPEPPKRPR